MIDAAVLDLIGKAIAYEIWRGIIADRELDGEEVDENGKGRAQAPQGEIQS